MIDSSALTAWFDERVADSRFSGVASVACSGEPVFVYAGGIAHRGHSVPVTPDTRFRVASISKMPVAATVLRLVSCGLLDLDEPVLRRLPPEWVPAAVSEQHTLRHLLAHMSGLANYHDVDDDTFRSFLACWERVPPQLVRRPSDLLPLFADAPPRASPGARFEYGDVNYVVIGMVIEAATGDPFHEVVRREVFEPAGMVDSGFEANDADPARLAVGYTSSERPFAEWTTNVFGLPAAGMPDGGMITTAADLHRFVRALLDGELVDAAALAAMCEPQGPASDELEQYGFGLELVVDAGNVTIVGHGGSDPGISTIVSHWLAADTTVVVLCNHDRGSWPASRALSEAFDLHDPRE
jgi:CubicO group peptidase (beta-lactamase class C family)